MIPPQKAKRKIRTDKNLTIAAGKSKEIIDSRATGIVESLVVNTDSPKLAVLIDLDGQEEQYTIEDLAAWGLLSYVPGVPYVEKYDTANDIYVFALIHPNGDMYYNKIRMVLINTDTTGPISVRMYRLKRWTIKDYLE